MIFQTFICRFSTFASRRIAEAPSIPPVVDILHCTSNHPATPGDYPEHPS